MNPETSTLAPRSMPRIGDLAPDFKAMTTQGELTFSDYADGSWVLLFSHPADFTPVCSTELVELARRQKEFEERGMKLIGLSIDSIHAHLAWRENLREILDTEIAYPMIADHRGEVAALYGMVHPGENSTVTVRAVFFIDPKRTIRAIIYYPLNVGRSVGEILRAVDALQTTDRNAVATPVDWKPGDKVIVPPPKTDKEARERRTNQEYEKLDFYLCKRELAH